ncbi:MAG: prepilin-type N-terminal cleavage/methylation domain-containing protein [Pseudoxanthomonas sp.]
MRSAMPSRRSSQSGFTLLEVIVAFALLALALSLLLGALSGATRQVRGAEDAGRAALHAQSLLAQAGVGVALRPGVTEGEWEGGRYRWQLQVSPYADPARSPPMLAAPGTARLLQLQLDVRWGEAAGQTLQVRSLRRVAGGEAAQ